MAIAALVASIVLLIFVLLLRRDVQHLRTLEREPKQPETPEPQHGWWWHLVHKRGHV